MDARRVLDDLCSDRISASDAAAVLSRASAQSWNDCSPTLEILIDEYVANGRLAEAAAERLRDALIVPQGDAPPTRLGGISPINLASTRDLQGGTTASDAATRFRSGAARDDISVSGAATRVREPPVIGQLDPATTTTPGSSGSADTVFRRSAVSPAVGDSAATRARAPEPVSSGDAEQMKGGLEAGSIVHNWYQLESLLGFGAMGQVWKALDLQRQRAGDPHPHVALKLVSHEFAQHRHAMVAMQREASKAQQLAHPNIATVFVFAEDPTTGQGYLAMELLEGQPLDRMLREYPSGIPRDRALDIIRGIASGLAYAHAKGIVHCDFKPGNAFVTDAGVAKVLDFGIARLAHAVARDGDSFDAGVLEALTPPYASLEMLQGGDPSPADDVYALGLVAYEVLAGRHPFGGRAATEVLEKGLKARPPKGVRRREWRAIERALRLRRSERWPDAQAFLKALAGTSPWVLAMGGLAAIFAVGAGYASYQNWREAQPAQPFESLPEATQAEFRRHMELGSDAYRFAEGAISDEEAASVIYRDAIEQFAEAYSLHPKNHEAEAALRSSLDLLGDRLEKANSALRKEALVTLQDYKENQFPALRRYAPLDQTIADLDK